MNANIIKCKVLYYFKIDLDASTVLSQSPGALQLRYLQTLNSIAAEKNSTIIFPLPLELMRAFYDGL